MKLSGRTHGSLYITLCLSDGRRCRDGSLHDETFLKENLETLFAYRQAVGFAQLAGRRRLDGENRQAQLVRLGRSIEEADDLPPLPAPPAWTESKQRHREALKKLALGQKAEPGTELAADHVVKKLWARLLLLS